MLFVLASFEVKIDGTLVFSKLKVGGFPDKQDVSCSNTEFFLRFRKLENFEKISNTYVRTT